MAKRVTDQVRNVYAELLADPKWSGTSVHAIHEEGRRRLRDVGLAEPELPSEAWAYKYIAASRRNLTGRDKWLESPFTLGSLSDKSLPSDPTSIEFLGLLYRRSIVGGTTFSNRRAIWGARLAHFFPEKHECFWRFYWAWYWIKRYADSELAGSLVEEFRDSGVSLDHELLLTGWPGNVSDSEQWSDVGHMLLNSKETAVLEKMEQPGFRRRLRQKLEQIDQVHLMPSAWDDIIAERYLHIADLLIGTYENESWNKSLSNSQYDNVFLALRTVMDRPEDGRPLMKLPAQLELTDQIAAAVRIDNSKLVRRLIDESGALREV
ncbi:hypothetical protein GKN94_11335 [Candidatus Lucifugimonas marina]|uniref:hypothetical protein n=1 Tax=Candidatus Lucifugimonas marina TaxID=3038979 RepID=UPI0027A9B332|nr:hypothetical protein GKN94_11335 [SAR202 cluster bacterium JH545]